MAVDAEAALSFRASFALARPEQQGEPNLRVRRQAGSHLLEELRLVLGHAPNLPRYCVRGCAFRRLTTSMSPSKASRRAQTFSASVLRACIFC